MKKEDVSPLKSVGGKTQASRILTVLGSDWFAKFTAVRIPGNVVWCNFELARALGFDVPSSNCMTSRFHQQLVDALSYRALKSKEEVNGHKTVTLYADRYGGEGIGNGLGSARSAFLPFGNLYLKGVGLTPLFRPDDPEDIDHSHGGAQLNHCLGEAIFGEVDQHLLTHGSTRILAIIDQGKCVVHSDGRKVAIALGVRCGRQLRPGHLLSKQVRSRSLLEPFIKITKETRQLVMRKDAARGREIPDVKATMLRVIDDHARTTAEHFRWRMIHGAITSSNMEMGGASLDLTTRSAQPRTAPVYFREDYVSFFGHEHIDCAGQLRISYRALVKSIPRQQRPRLSAKSFDFIRVMEQSYDRHLQKQLLGATGLKAAVAERLRLEHSDLARRFTATVVAMCSLRNPGSVEMARQVVKHVSVLDVFNLLREFPREYFATANGKHTRVIRVLLKPVFKGTRFQVAKQRTKVSLLIAQFDRVYRELMQTCRVYAKDYYGRIADMQASITSRAAFENEPITLYRSKLYEDFEEAIKAYELTGDADVLQAIVETRVSASLRKVDALLAQGKFRLLSDGGLELEIQTISGINYSIRAWNDRQERRHLHVSVPVTRIRNCFESPSPGWPRLRRQQISSLRYCFTTDGWISSRVVSARIEKDAQGYLFISFDIISKLPLAGRLEGFFYLTESPELCLGDQAVRFNRYTFAIPDKQELAELTKNHSLRRCQCLPSQPARRCICPV
jgi:hypothetical protein